RRGALTIAVSTEGECPAFASVLREELGAQFGEEYAEVVRILGALRRQWIAQGWGGERIRQAIQDLYRSGIVDAVRNKDRLPDLD
ncbi:MAG TPA: hypothetical protein VMT86_13090, partial [Bryobacteraceae bacterium]|nr:hypothetical protein [Bryobacteraceae bacterium]